MRTYNPFPSWLPAAYAAAVVLAAYVVGPAIGEYKARRTLARCDQIFNLDPTEGATR